MNLDDLKSSLATIADEADATEPVSQLAGVDRSTRRVRRDRALIAAAGATAVLCTGAALFLPGVVSGDDGANPPSRPGPSNPTSLKHHGTAYTGQTDLPTVSDQGVRFYAKPAGDPLAGEVVGQVGQQSVTMTATASTSSLSLLAECLLPSAWSVRELPYEVRINGKPFGQFNCGRANTGALQATSRFAASPVQNGQAWTHEYGVRPGQPFTMTMKVRPEYRDDPRLVAAQLALAVWEDHGQRLKDHGVWMRRQIVADGHTYQLAARSFAAVDGGRGRLTMRLPESSDPVWIVIGSTGVRGSYRILGADGAAGGSISGGGPTELGNFSEPGVHSVAARLRSHGTDETGLLYSLAYVRID